MKELDPNKIPRHVAIIMDGNGRWAKQQGKMRTFGHKSGLEAVRKSVSYARQIGLQTLTLYAFSSENWNRPQQEVTALMTLFMQALDLEVKKLHKNNICLKILGDISRFTAGLLLGHCTGYTKTSLPSKKRRVGSFTDHGRTFPTKSGHTTTTSGGFIDSYKRRVTYQ